MINIPELEHGSNNWIVTCAFCNKSLVETSDRSKLGMIHRNYYRVETAGQYLVRFNREIQQIA